MAMADLVERQRQLDTTIAEQGEAALTIEEWELCATIGAVQNIVNLDFTDVILANSLSNWPIYQRMMQDPDNGAHKTRGRALMIGSASVLSSTAFTRLADEVYGTKRSVVVDKVGGVSKIHAGNFVFGDGFELPFKSKSFTLVHTDRLLPSLVDASDSLENFPTVAFNLAKEIARVLRKGGQVFMNEFLPGLGTNLSNESINAALHLTNRLLKTVMDANGIRTTAKYAKLPGDIAYWHDRSRNLKAYQTIDINTLALHGQKVQSVENPQYPWES